MVVVLTMKKIVYYSANKTLAYKKISTQKYVHNEQYRQGIQDAIDEIFPMFQHAKKRLIKGKNADELDIYNDMAPVIYGIADDFNIKIDFLREWRGFIEDVIYYSYKLALESMEEIEAIKSSLNQLIMDRNIRHGVSLKIRYSVLKRDCFKCRACGISPSYDPAVVLMVDHAIPLSKGGENSLENCQTLCQFCNAGKSDSH
jgi:hypothetical protein